MNQDEPYRQPTYPAFQPRTSMPPPGASAWTKLPPTGAPAPYGSGRPPGRWRNLPGGVRFVVLAAVAFAVAVAVAVVVEVAPTATHGGGSGHRYQPADQRSYDLGYEAGEASGYADQLVREDGLSGYQACVNAQTAVMIFADVPGLAGSMAHQNGSPSNTGDYLQGCLAAMGIPGAAGQ